MSAQFKTPPPPPPPPPPSSSPSPGKFISAINGKPQNNPRMIEPTTTGLIQRPQFENQRLGVQQVVGCPPSMPTMSSPEFKNELLARQSQISSASATSTIDDRIKSRKEEENNWRQRDLENENSFNNGCHQDHQMKHMPDKLVSTIKGDIRPFSYSVGFNDPNNKGKLDLSQIKSPTMRRRLLMNMVSLEEANEDSEREEPQNHCNEIQSGSSRPDRFIDKAPLDQAVYKKVPIVEYKNPPMFYNLSPPIQQNLSRENQTQTRISNDYLHDLDLEVANSLDSLTSLVNSLPQPRISRPNPNEFNPISTNNFGSRIEYLPHSDRGVSTFLPHDGTINRSKTLSNRSSPIESYSATPTRSVGDYLIAPDSSYFSICSRSEPYSVSPYYGSHLDENNYNGLTTNYLREPQASSKTFSPYSMNI